MQKVRKAIEEIGISKVAKALKVKQPTVSAWLARGQVSHRKVLELSELTGVPAHEIRPDIYPPPREVA